MFGIKTIKVIAFSKGVLLYASVRIGREATITSTDSIRYTNENIPQIIEAVVKKHKIKECRILISDSLCYIVTFPLPEETLGIRDFIKVKLQERIPENLSDKAWDYKLIKNPEKNEKDNIIVFAMVGDFFTRLSSVVEKLKLKVTAIESDTIASTRCSNPIIGLALKRDIDGKDSDTLNLSI